MRAVLIIQTGKHKGRKIKFPADGRLLIGRDKECHLRLGSTDVSRKHCELRQMENGISVKELGSRNGTFIDDFLISETALLQPGSVLRVGNMEFQLPGKRPSAAASPPKQFEDTSDNDIAAWLTAEGETDQPSLEESTIIPREKTVSPPEPELSNRLDYSRHPHAEQAAEIIRDHWEKKLRE